MSMTGIEKMQLEIAGLREGLEIAQDELNRCREAYLFVLPYLHLDIREQALRIYDLPPTELEKTIGALGKQRQPDGKQA